MDRYLAAGVTFDAFEPDRLGVVSSQGAPVAKPAAHPEALPGAMFRSGHLTDYLLLDLRAGIEVASRYPGRGATICVSGSKAWIAPGANNCALVAVQGYPRLVHDGIVAPLAVDEDRVGRGALCILASGKVALAHGTMGMQPFAQALVAGGVVEAVYLDGSSSFAAGALLPAWIVVHPQSRQLDVLKGLR